MNPLANIKRTKGSTSWKNAQERYIIRRYIRSKHELKQRQGFLVQTRVGITTNHSIPRNHIFFLYPIKQLTSRINFTTLGIHINECINKLKRSQMATSRKNTHHRTLIGRHVILLHAAKASQGFFKSTTLNVPRNYGIPRDHIFGGNLIKKTSSIIHVSLRYIASNKSGERDGISESTFIKHQARMV
ncbi:hypothetical protein CR513_07847, partial [Mucuna pruriens]